MLVHDAGGVKAIFTSIYLIDIYCLDINTAMRYFFAPAAIRTNLSMDTKTLCLAALSLGDATGYEIKKQFEEGPLSHFYRTGFGSIYPALNELRAQGLATVTAHIQENKPDKKVYALTAAGRHALVHALLKRPADDQVRSEFLVMMAFSALLPQSFIASVVDDRLKWYRNEAERIGRLLATETVGPGRRFVRGFGRAIYAAAARYIEDNRHLLLAGDPEPNRRTGS